MIQFHVETPRADGFNPCWLRFTIEGVSYMLSIEDAEAFHDGITRAMKIIRQNEELRHARRLASIAKEGRNEG